MIKGPIIDIDNRFNKVFPSFDLFNKEFSSGLHIIDAFPNHFLFHSFNKQSDRNYKTYIHYLDNISIVFSLDPSYALVVTNASIKNNMVMSIAHAHIYDKPVIKTIHHTVNIMTTEAELFAIRCGINQAINIITDLLHATQRIFDSSLYSFQIYIASILDKLKFFFIKAHNNSIKFWEYPSQYKWPLYKAVNKETKQFHPQSLYPCKST